MPRIGKSLAAVSLALVVAGCGASTGSSSPSTALTAAASSGTAPSSSGKSAASSGIAGNIQPGVVTDIGGLGDRGFNDLAKTGMDQADQQHGLKGKILVPQTPADYTNDLDQLARSGAQPVFGVGFSLADAVKTVAQKYPRTRFGLVDSTVDLPNVTSLLFKEQEGSFLAGVVAGDMTTVKTAFTDPTNKVVGFIGGQDAPLIEKFGAGYEQGVKSVCPDCTVLYQYVGTTTEAFSNPAAAAEIARDMHTKGADVIYHAAGGSGDGLFKVATDQKFFAIGVNTDQAATNPQAPILTSMLKRVDTAVSTTISAAVSGKPTSGPVTYGLANKGVGLAGFGRFTTVVPANVKQAVTDATKKIISGQIKVATARAAEGK